jgi:hypothetical protein
VRAVCAIVLAALLAGCGGSEASLTVGAEGFEPPIVSVPAEESFDLEVRNDTQAVQTVTVAGRPPLRIAAGGTSTRQVEALAAGDHRVTLVDAPFEATLRAER